MKPSPKPKIRMVRREPPSFEDVEKFAEVFSQMAEAGDFDTHLDVLWKSVNNRLNVYFDGAGTPDDAQQRRAERIRRMRKAPEIVVGYIYDIYGDKYKGVRVKVLGHAEESESDAPKVRVQVVFGNKDYPIGSIYKLLAGALEEIPGISQTELKNIYDK